MKINPKALFPLLILLWCTNAGFGMHLRFNRPDSIIIPVGGNMYITKEGAAGTEKVNKTALSGWTDPNSVFTVYFRLSHTGPLNIKIKAKVPAGRSRIQAVVNGSPFTVALQGEESKIYTVGTINIRDSGYVRVDFNGISKSGLYYAVISDLIISGPAADSKVLFADDPANFYWSRRGPSVHLTYGSPEDTEWIYNELTVPKGEDKVGSYYMANGFGEGYFGIQVNSASERRILFSVWDPDKGRTTLVRKGPGVVDNHFGGEGTGGQSYLVFDWEAGTTYKFLTRGKPDGQGNTIYSSWIYTPESSSWRFIAEWKRASTTTYLTRFHSFLENFYPENGYLDRKVFFGNQWVCSSSGEWTERTTAVFTVDATGANKQRMDFQGGSDGRRFYLKNGGFFADYTPAHVKFIRKAEGKKPKIDFSSLP